VPVCAQDSGARVRGGVCVERVEVEVEVHRSAQSPLTGISPLPERIDTALLCRDVHAK
jgi:hypothetical protein